MDYFVVRVRVEQMDFSLRAMLFSSALFRLLHR
jgi:hypothetical protein